MSDQPATRIVRCCHCRGMMRVAARALSVFCPHCQKRVTLESLRIVGSHPGRTLATCGDIIVEPASLLNLEITANNVVIRGRVNGSVIANGRLEVASTGQVYGNVKAARIIVEEGGIIQGRCEMSPSPQAVRRPAPPPEMDGNRDADSMPEQDAELENATAASERPRQIRPISLD
ncbi:MAG: polymer-forming cytoskeletal protein [Phycisphaerales bacterium]|nr:polymer-forming cytoskeletal protein [Phycisphaerales bacterium]MCB9862448.1 polymer-forming cytoskeletal protein [Phycisphaerales bacterium]